MNPRYIILTLFTCLWGSLLLAQQGSPGRVTVIQDPAIDTILQRHIQMNERLLQNPDNYAIDGYRIQIFEESGNRSSSRAREVMEEFGQKYPGMPAYLTWQAPNFKVRVGDFGSRMQAEGFLEKIKQDYPIAWVIRDKIKFPIIN